MEVRVKCILCNEIVHAKGIDDEVSCTCGNVKATVGDAYAKIHSDKGFEYLGEEDSYVQPHFPDERHEKEV